MGHSIGKNLLLSAFAMLTIISCRKNVEPTIEQAAASDYDQVLKTQLELASNGQGLSFFKLPNSQNLAAIPQDPTNPLTKAKVELGRLLFHETGLALNPIDSLDGSQTYSCASCHHAWAGFQANMQQGIGEGGMGFGVAGEGRVPNPQYSLADVDVQPLRTPSAMNSAYQKVMLWNGQFGATGPNAGTDALWPMGTPIWNNKFGHEGVETQAIAGLTVHRLSVTDDLCIKMTTYRKLFDLAFMDWPAETRYSERTAGLAIAAYERTLLSNEAPFQEWLSGDHNALTDSEKRGAALFFGEANCSSCHTGPALNSMSFYALGMDDMIGNATIRTQENDPANRGRGSFTQNPEDDYKFKTPQLYNLKDSPFYGHGGTFTSVREVIEYKNTGVPENPNTPLSQLAEEFKPLDLTDQEITDLVNFIENGLYDPNLLRYLPDHLPSGNCFPNNDVISVLDQGCAN